MMTRGGYISALQPTTRPTIVAVNEDPSSGVEVLPDEAQGLAQHSLKPASVRLGGLNREPAIPAASAERESC